MVTEPILWCSISKITAYGPDICVCLEGGNKYIKCTRESNTVISSLRTLISTSILFTRFIGTLGTFYISYRKASITVIQKNQEE